MTESHLENSSGTNSCYRFKYLALVISVAAPLLCFIPDLGNGLLIWDDRLYTVNNSHIRHFGVDTFRWAFTEFFAGSWFPLTWISFALDYALWKLDPFGYHLTNNILHALNAGFFYLVCIELLSRCHTEQPIHSRSLHTGANRQIIFCSLLASLLFSLHPLRVESVAWVAERKDVLSLFFGLPAVIAYLRHTRKTWVTPIEFTGSRWYWGSLVLFGLSLCSKPMMVTLPLVLLILDRYPLDRFGNGCNSIGLLLEKVPFMVISVGVSLLTYRSQIEMINSHADINFASRMLNAARSVIAYLWLTIWPAGISPFYLHPGTISLSIEYIIPIVMILAISVGCALSYRRQPLLATAWLVYLITLIPVIGITQVGAQSMAARYTYLPGLPVALLAAIAITCGYERLKGRVYPRFALITATVLMLISLSALTNLNIAHWKDDVTLWSRVINLQSHTVGRAYFQRSAGYVLRGDFLNALADINEAISIASAKRYGEMHTLYIERARIYKQLGELDRAVADYSSALLTDKPAKQAMYFWERGSIYREQGKAELAEDDFRRSEMIQKRE